MTRSFSRGKPRHGGELVALRARALRAGAQRVAVGRRIVARGRAARLHGVDDEALVDRRDARHMRGAGEDRPRSRAHCCRRPAPGRASRSRRCPALREKAAARRRRAPRAHRRPREAPRSRPRPVSAASCACAMLSATTSATGWPTCITRSRASAGRNGTISFAPLRPTSGGCTEVEPTPAASISLWVSTATHAGRGACRLRVDRRMRACACGERTNTAWAWFGCGASSTKRPSPLHQRVVFHARLEMMVVLRSPDPRALLRNSACQSYSAIK